MFGIVGLTSPFARLLTCEGAAVAAVTTDVIAGLTAAVDELCEADVVGLGDAESIQALYRQVERLGAVVARASAAFDAGRAWEADGARSAAAWLGRRCGQPVSVARRRVALGRALRDMPVVEGAWLAGELSESHVGLLVAARTPATAACFERDQALLVEQAGRLGFAHFARGLAYWRQRADPDGCDDAAAAQHRARRVHLSQSFEGVWALDGLLDPVSGAIVARALGRVEDDLFAADWAEARARLGEAASAADLARSPAQRRADALVELARRSQAMPAGARQPEPLFTVLVGEDSFARVCELADRTVVAPGSLVRWLGSGWVERVVFDGPERVTGVGVRRRIFTGATRRAIEVRDRECFHEFCDVAAECCEIDHVQPWATGGLTVQGNGRVACGYHNRRRFPRRGPP